MSCRASTSSCWRAEPSLRSCWCSWGLIQWGGAPAAWPLGKLLCMEMGISRSLECFCRMSHALLCRRLQGVAFVSGLSWGFFFELEILVFLTVYFVPLLEGLGLNLGAFIIDSMVWKHWRHNYGMVCAVAGLLLRLLPCQNKIIPTPESSLTTAGC